MEHYSAEYLACQGILLGKIFFQQIYLFALTDLSIWGYNRHSQSIKEGIPYDETDNHLPASGSGAALRHRSGRGGRHLHAGRHHRGALWRGVRQRQARHGRPVARSRPRARAAGGRGRRRGLGCPAGAAQRHAERRRGSAGGRPAADPRRHLRRRSRAERCRAGLPGRDGRRPVGRDRRAPGRARHHPVGDTALHARRG